MPDGSRARAIGKAEFEIMLAFRREFGGVESVDHAGMVPLEALAGEFSSAFTMAGFDAIFQMRTDLVQRILRANVRGGGVGPFTATVPYDSYDVPQEVRQEIDQLIAAGDPVAVQVRLIDPVVRTLRGELPDEAAAHFPQLTQIAEIAWGVSLRLVIQVWSTREHDSSPGGGGLIDRGTSRITANVAADPGSQKVLAPDWTALDLGSGSIRTFAEMRAASGRGRFTVWADLDFIPAAVDATSDDPIFIALLGSSHHVALDDALQTLFAGAPIPVTPHISLPTPEMPPVPVDTAPPEPVAVQVAVIQSRGHEVLALCVNAPRGPQRGNPNMVIPFLTTQNFACCISLEIIRSIVQDRWPRLGLPRGFYYDGPFEIVDPDDQEIAFKGRARVRFTLLSTRPTVSLVESPFPFEDALRLVCQHEIQLLELRDENGDRVELGDLAAPAQSPLSWRVQLFERDGGAESAAGDFFRHAGAVILDPLYHPIIEPMRLRRIEGVTLSTRGLVFFRGDLQ